MTFGHYFKRYTIILFVVSIVSFLAFNGEMKTSSQYWGNYNGYHYIASESSYTSDAWLYVTIPIIVVAVIILIINFIKYIQSNKNDK